MREYTTTERENNLRKIRRDYDWTQYELKLKTGIEQSALSLIEKGYKIPSERQMKAIAHAFYKDIYDIFPNQKEKK